MSLALDPAGPMAGRPVLSRPAPTVWVLVDASLLTITLMLSADMLINLRPVQSLLWLYCYGMTLVRIAMVWPAFLPVLGRNRLLMLYPAICVASVLWSASKGYSLTASVQLSMTMLIATYLGWRYSIAVILKAVAAVLSVGVALSLLHWATGIFPWPVYTRIGGLAGLFSGKNMLGLRALFAVIALFAILLMARREGGVGPMLRLVAVGAVLGNLMALALALSMTSVLLLPVTTAILLLLCAHRLPPVVAAGGIAVAVLGLALGPLVTLGILGIDPVETVLGSVGKSTTLTGRTKIWAVGWDVHRDHPVLGVGYRAFWKAPQFFNERFMTQDAGAITSSSFHNFVLEILVSAGWAAVAAMGVLVAVTVSRLSRAYAATRSVPMGAALSLVFAILVAAAVGTNLYRGHESMMVLMVAFAVSAGEDLRRLRMRRAPPRGGPAGAT